MLVNQYLIKLEKYFILVILEELELELVVL